MPTNIYWFDSKDVETIILQSKLDSCINRISVYILIQSAFFIHLFTHLISFWVLPQLYKV